MNARFLAYIFCVRSEAQANKLAWASLAHLKIKINQQFRLGDGIIKLNF